METISLAAEVIGRRLSEIRNERNLTIQRMAVNADIDPKHLKKMENGISEPSVLVLNKIMKSIGGNLTDFFDNHFDEIYFLVIEERGDCFEKE